MGRIHVAPFPYVYRRTSLSSIHLTFCFLPPLILHLEVRWWPAKDGEGQKYSFNIRIGVVKVGFLTCNHFLALGLKNDAPGLRLQRVVLMYLSYGQGGYLVDLA
jgi:hypothetical protein